MTLKLIRYLFITEALINSISTVIFLAKPEMMLQGLIADTSLITPLALEMLRWHGCLLLVVTLILWRALFIKNPEPLRIALQAHLFGDIVYLISQVQLASFAGWVFGTYFGIGFVTVAFISRCIYLLKTRTNLAPT